MHGRRLSLSRRTFIGGIAVLPALWSRATADDSLPPSRLYQREAPPITSAEQVLNVPDFEPLARVALPPAAPSRHTDPGEHYAAASGAVA